MSQTPDSRLREAEKQISLAMEDIDDKELIDELGRAAGYVTRVRNLRALDDADQELTGEA